jgi:hypothetical protein
MSRRRKQLQKQREEGRKKGRTRLCLIFIVFCMVNIKARAAVTQRVLLQIFGHHRVKRLDIPMIDCPIGIRRVLIKFLVKEEDQARKRVTNEQISKRRRGITKE